MPNAALKPCSYPGCVELVKSGRCEAHQVGERFYRDAGRQALYDRRWRRRRAIQLTDFPWCKDCLTNGVYTVATDVHHEQRHEGDVITFLVSPLVSLCHACHAKRTMQERVQ